MRERLWKGITWNKVSGSQGNWYPIPREMRSSVTWVSEKVNSGKEWNILKVVWRKLDIWKKVKCLSYFYTQISSRNIKDVNRKAFNNKCLNANFNDKDSSTPELSSIPMLVVKINSPYIISIISRSGQDRLFSLLKNTLLLLLLSCFSSVQLCATP